MVRAKECCCGCTLRNGTLILLWISLVLNLYGTSLYLESTFATSRYHWFYRVYSGTGFRWHEIYFLIWSIIGVVTSILGIIGIQKNLPKYLNGYLYFMYYECIYYVFLILVLILRPSFYYYVSQWIIFIARIFTTEGSTDSILVEVIGHVFFLASYVYFVLIIKSCRDALLKNEREHKIADIPDPVAVGYSLA